LLGDSDLAEDCVAESFSRLLNAVHRGNGPNENVRAWVYRVAHNWISDHYRRKPPIPWDMDANLHGNESSNSSVLISKLQEVERVRAALLRLPPDQGQVIQLRFLEGWNHEKVAKALGKSSEATRALQYRA